MTLDMSCRTGNGLQVSAMATYSFPALHDSCARPMSLSAVRFGRSRDTLRIGTLLAAAAELRRTSYAALFILSRIQSSRSLLPWVYGMS